MDPLGARSAEFLTQNVYYTPKKQPIGLEYTTDRQVVTQTQLASSRTPSTHLTNIHDSLSPSSGLLFRDAIIYCQIIITFMSHCNGTYYNLTQSHNFKISNIG